MEAAQIMSVSEPMEDSAGEAIIMEVATASEIACSACMVFEHCELVSNLDVPHLLPLFDYQIMELEQSLSRAEIQQAHRQAKRALLHDDIATGLASCSEARLKLNDLLEEVTRPSSLGITQHPGRSSSTATVTSCKS